MKAFLYILLILLVFIAGIWILNSFGVVSVKAWGEDIITSTPFLKEYVTTNEAYTQVSSNLDELNKEIVEIKEERDILQRQYRAAGKTIEEQGDRIEELEDELAVLSDNKLSEEERINKLVKIYGEMDAEKAAEIFLSLDDDMVIDILTNLKEGKAAEILTSLPAEEAARYSKAIQ